MALYILFKICQICKDSKPMWEFGPSGQRSADGWEYRCYECRRQIATRKRAGRGAWRDNDNAKLTRWRRKLKSEIFAAYGNRCQCCGETTFEFLTIDHIHSDGAADRKVRSGYKFYVWLKRSGYPRDRFQLLCWNCNMARGLFKVCPHSIEEKSLGG